jgi:A/G-specific adenine glycosylase
LEPPRRESPDADLWRSDRRAVLAGSGPLGSRRRVAYGDRVPGPSNAVNSTAVVDRVLEWYERSARDLPWRRPEATPWEVVVSEFMLQQTPVARVLEPWHAWVTRWPTPAALAQEPAGEAIRAWGRLGYPRRALRLHRAAQLIVERHGGEVPNRLEDLLALPGVGSYTAAAVASFAFRSRHCVLDTNVRRFLGRLVSGDPFPPRTLRRSEQSVAESFVAVSAARAAGWAVAAMEFGALVCTPRTPRCGDCPVADQCRWQALGAPDSSAIPTSQGYQGTDRQCRGVLLAALRAAAGPISRATLLATWPVPEQGERCLESLISDGLTVRVDGDRIGLPG